jgi:hypothetical protein
MVTTEPYDETRIVSLITEIYKIQHLLSYLPDDAIAYSPPSGHQIDGAACEQTKLAPAVISLMKKLPYPKDFDGIAYSYPFLNDTFAAVYTETECIIRGRDPENYVFDKPMRWDLLKPCEIVLTFARRDGVNILLDTEQSMNKSSRTKDEELNSPLDTIRWWAPDTSAQGTWPEESEEYKTGFPKRDGEDWARPHDYFPRPAVEVLQEIINKYHSLEWIPRCDDWPRIVQKDDLEVCGCH